MLARRPGRQAIPPAIRRPRGGAARRWIGRIGAALLFGAASGAAIAEPALWRISDEDSTVWLFGSVHSLPDETEWRRPELKQALNAADAVYFEAPMDLFAQAELQSYVLATGLYPPGQRLSQNLPPEVSARLYQVARLIGMDPAQLEATKPWFAVMILSAKLAEAGGAKPDNGVDPALALDAMRAKKDVRAFETLQQQADFFATLDHELQLEVLRLTLDEAEVAEQSMTDLVDAWEAGDTETLETLIFDSMDGAPTEFMERLFYRRNAAWAEELATYLEGSGSALVVVGAGHLVGERSLIDLLEKKGWSAERF